MLGDMEGVFEIPNLLHLTYWDNPVEKLTAIEHVIVTLISTLKILQNRVIDVEERSYHVSYPRMPMFIDKAID